MMTSSERTQLAGLPERVEVYRGVNGLNYLSSIAWTLDRERAVWFARRFPGPRGLIAGRVLRRRIIALFNERQEREVLVFPRHVYGRSVTALDG